jgi:hypothetical protein
MSNSTAVAPVSAQSAGDIMERVIAVGDLSKLQPEERVLYYNRTCESLGLNPLTRPFEYIYLNNKLTLYARKDCTDQLRSLKRVSVAIVDRQRIEDIYAVTARATMPDGRTDESIGAVPIAGLKGDNLANALMKAECVPLGSEILTRDGWKTYDQLQIGEEVLAYDCETDTCRWVPLLNVTVHEKLPMARLYTEKGQFEVFCTPDHSWAVEKAGYRVRSTGARGVRGPYKNRRPDRMLVKACEINSGHRLVLAAPEVGASDGLLTPVEAAILGWAVTDGTIRRVGNSVRIGMCQSKEHNFEPIRELVAAVAPGTKEIVNPARTRTFPTGRTYDTKEQHWWYLPAEISRLILERAGFHDRSDLPRIVTRLSSPARKAILQAMMLAEGDARGNFANTDRHILDAFQILCALEGVAVGQEHQRHGVIVARQKKTRHAAGSFLRLELIGEQPAWCPTTPLGTWVMRQNGRIMITGNTKAKRRVTLSICGLGMLDETELETIPATTRAEPAQSPRQAERNAAGLARCITGGNSHPQAVTGTDEDAARKAFLVREIPAWARQTYDGDSAAFATFRANVLGVNTPVKQLSLEDLEKLWAAIQKAQEPQVIEDEVLPASTPITKGTLSLLLAAQGKLVNASLITLDGIEADIKSHGADTLEGLTQARAMDLLESWERMLLASSSTLTPGEQHFDAALNAAE